jgi:hypothetical protein
MRGQRKIEPRQQVIVQWLLIGLIEPNRDGNIWRQAGIEPYLPVIATALRRLAAGEHE